MSCRYDKYFLSPTTLVCLLFSTRIVYVCFVSLSRLCFSVLLVYLIILSYRIVQFCGLRCSLKSPSIFKCLLSAHLCIYIFYSVCICPALYLSLFILSFVLFISSFVLRLFPALCVIYQTSLFFLQGMKSHFRTTRRTRQRL